MSAYISRPPLTPQTWPVMYADAFDARKRTAFATSSAEPSRPSQEIDGERAREPADPHRDTEQGQAVHQLEIVPDIFAEAETGIEALRLLLQQADKMAGFAGRQRGHQGCGKLAIVAARGEAEPPEHPMSADRVRWEHIQRIYEMCNRNVSETARRLNMHRRTLQRILAKRAPK